MKPSHKPPFVTEAKALLMPLTDMHAFPEQQEHLQFLKTNTLNETLTSRAPPYCG